MLQVAVQKCSSNCASFYLQTKTAAATQSQTRSKSASSFSNAATDLKIENSFKHIPSIKTKLFFAMLNCSTMNYKSCELYQKKILYID